MLSAPKLRSIYSIINLQIGKRYGYVTVFITQIKYRDIISTLCICCNPQCMLYTIDFAMAVLKDMPLMSSVTFLMVLCNSLRTASTPASGAFSTSLELISHSPS